MPWLLAVEAAISSAPIFVPLAADPGNDDNNQQDQQNIQILWAYLEKHSEAAEAAGNAITNEASAVPTMGLTTSGERPPKNNCGDNIHGKVGAGSDLAVPSKRSVPRLQ